jgi:hypothetical protein
MDIVVDFFMSSGKHRDHSVTGKVTM